MSSTNSGENPEHRKLKVSWATQIVSGLGGPKSKPKGVSDGQLVNIPALPNGYLLLTHLERSGGILVMPVPCSAQAEWWKEKATANSIGVDWVSRKGRRCSPLGIRTVNRHR